MVFKAKDVDDKDQSPARDNSTILVIDGDELAYVHAITAEKQLLVYRNTTNEFEHGFKNKTEFGKFMAGLDIPEGMFETELKRVAEPKQNAFSTIKKKLLWLQNKFNTDNIEIYISGKDNFRDFLPLPKHPDPEKSGQYKGQRDPSAKPLLLEEVKEYLIQYWNAKVVDFIEADDFLCMRVFEGYNKKQEKVIGLTQDKDRLGNVGYWYDYLNDADGKGQPQLIEGLGDIWLDTSKKTSKPWGAGRKWLYFQWISGDPVDNYNPRDVADHLGLKLKSFGAKTALALLQPLKSDAECFKAVHDLYLSWYGADKFTYTTWDDKVVDVDYIDIMQLYFDCARMRRWENDLVDVRSVLKKMKVIE
jgi:hypothetical protein